MTEFVQQSFSSTEKCRSCLFVIPAMSSLQQRYYISIKYRIAQRNLIHHSFLFFILFSVRMRISLFSHSLIITLFFFLFFILFPFSIHFYFLPYFITFSSAYESALDSLPRPTVILCKSARRAGAVLNAYVVRSLIYRVVLFCGAIYRIFEFYDQLYYFVLYCAVILDK